MKRFKFRLDPVLRYRQYRERLAMMELARARQALVLSEKKIQQVQQIRKGVITDLNARQTEVTMQNSHLPRTSGEVRSSSSRAMIAGTKPCARCPSLS